MDQPDYLVAAQVAKQRHTAACNRIQDLTRTLMPLTHYRQEKREEAVARLKASGMTQSAAKENTHSDPVYSAYVQRIEELEADKQQAEHDRQQARMEFDYSMALLRACSTITEEE